MAIVVSEEPNAAAEEKRGQRGVILYDALFCAGGAERVLFEIGSHIVQADVCVGYTAGRTDLGSGGRQVGQNVLELGAPPVFNARVIRRFYEIYLFRNRTTFLQDYRWALFSGWTALAAVNNRRGMANLYYCHTPPRFAYDLHYWYLDSLPRMLKPLFRRFAEKAREEYEAALAEMSCVVANSSNVQTRLREQVGVDSIVVNPPCDTDRFRWGAEGEYYLSTARLEPYKRVDLAVMAFREMPDKRLVVASDGSDRKRLERIACGCENIEFVGSVDDEAMAWIVGRSIATIYLAKDEDFGISPVESMAAGKPVIASAKGGVLETVINGRTGVFVSADPTVDEVVQAVLAIDLPAAAAMRENCEKRAEEFNRGNFLRSIEGLISRHAS